MQYLLQSKKLIFLDNSNQVRCININDEIFLKSRELKLIENNFYAPVLSDISDIIGIHRKKNVQDILIIDSELFDCAGLENALNNYLGKEVLILSDLKLLIASDKLCNGDYTIVDISEKDSFCYSLRFSQDTYLMNKYKLKHDELIDLINKKYCNNLFKELTSCSTVIEVNELIKKKNDMNIDYKDYKLSEITQLEMIDENIIDFFSTIGVIIENYIKAHRHPDNILLIKSPLMGYLPIKSIFNKNKIKYVDELELLNISKNLDIFGTNNKLNHVLYDEHVEFQFKSWVLSEAEKKSMGLSIINQNNGESINIDLYDFKDILFNNYFFLGCKRVVKCFVEIYSDSYNNLHLKLETLDKKVYSTIIKNV